MDLKEHELKDNYKYLFKTKSEQSYFDELKILLGKQVQYSNKVLDDSSTIDGNEILKMTPREKFLYSIINKKGFIFKSSVILDDIKNIVNDYRKRCT